MISIAIVEDEEMYAKQLQQFLQCRDLAVGG